MRLPRTLPAWAIILYTVIDCVLGGDGKDSREEKFQNPPQNYDVFMVIRVFPNTTQQLEALQTLFIKSHEYEIDFWKSASGFGQFADIMVKEGARAMILMEKLKESEAKWTITIPDVQKLIIEREAPKKSSVLSRIKGNALLEFFFRRQKDDAGARYGFGEYHSYDTIMKWLDSVASANSGIAQTFTLGYTTENREIKGIKIGSPSSSTNKRAVWIDGGIHAREWASVHTALWFVQQLITGYETDPQIRNYVNTLNFYIVPLVNPDGYEYSRDDITPMHRLWRKNRGGITCKKDAWFRDRCCGGVDLNRNFEFHWGESGSSDDRCSEVFQGDSAFSEPESRAVRDKIMSPELWGKVDAFITLHTYAQMWIHPYSNARRSYPNDVQDMRLVGQRGVAALQRAFGTQYRFGTGADILYPSSGGSDDWAKGVAGIKYVYLLELRPADEVWDGFLLDPRQLIPTGKETWEGIKVVVQAVIDRQEGRSVQDDSADLSWRSRTPPPTPRRIETPPPTTTTTQAPTTTWRPEIITFAPQTPFAPQRPFTVQPPNAPRRLMNFGNQQPQPSNSFPQQSRIISPSLASGTADASQLQTVQVIEGGRVVNRPVWRNPNMLRQGPLTEQRTSSNLQNANDLRRRQQMRIRSRCVDRSPWCQAWVQGNPNVCQISSIYMSKDCARTCGFCRRRSRVMSLRSVDGMVPTPTRSGSNGTV